MTTRITDDVPQGTGATTSYLNVDPPIGKVGIVTILPISEPVPSTSTHVPPAS
ncbi:hypothetical protein FLACOL7796_04604 [Flavobacterium collinsii]|uniref:Uncharacterized protein n=1 Tax=Flavobacterium collinsii TaxID=1114861 RepID=A0ABM8KPY8_9FLAO|nr:hypothetical protein FLACOL7796_04604 [Flavobacterium collinsii]